MDANLARIRELINLKEKTDAELTQLITGVEKPKRPWRRKQTEQPTTPSS